jgi:DNA ligase D-like protein (predicted 3'-phosphoesterase)
VLFDILEKDGTPLVDLPLIERRRLLKESVKEGKHVALSLYVEGNGEEYYAAAIQRGLEGVMAKMKASRYEPGARSGSWLKIKRDLSCDCVIFGYTRGEGRRKTTFGALVLGLYDDGEPVYVGKVGTGFSDEDLDELMKVFDGLKVEERMLQGPEIPHGVTWLRPVLVCEIGYQTVTNDLKLRMPRFRGLRTDKSPTECTIDQIRPAPLEEYASKRDFSKTPEPRSEAAAADSRSFVVHEHHARRLHYDLRLERGGVLKSWAVPKGPPEGKEKRLAVETEDHPLEYGSFEGTIPEGQYGAGIVKIWDRGVYEPIVWERDKIELVMIGERLRGRYVLVRLKKAKEGEWLFFKATD